MSAVAGGKVRVYRSTESLGRWLRGLLVGSMVASVALGIFDLVSAADLRRLTHSFSPLFGTANWPATALPRAAPPGLSLLFSGVSIATGIVWLVWQHRTQSNLYAVGLPGLQYTPGWAVGWWFIPFANFVMPFRTVRELWTRSGATARRPPVGLWWTFYMGAIAVSLVALAVQFSSATFSGGVFSFRLTAVANARMVQAGAELVRMVAAGSAIQIVSGVERAQRGLSALPGALYVPGVLGVTPPRPDLGAPPG